MAYDKHDNTFIDYTDHSLIIEIVIVGLFIFLVILILTLEI